MTIDTVFDLASLTKPIATATSIMVLADRGLIGLDEPPYPAYTFEGRNLAQDPRVEIRIEDHYWDDSDAAVVFERRDTATGERRYLYHGNDGTSFPSRRFGFARYVRP